VVVGLPVPERLLGPRFNVFFVVLCVHYVRAERLPACVSFAPDSDVGRGNALPVPATRELWGPLVTPVSPLLYFACCSRMRVYGVCVEWGLVSESIAYRGVSPVRVCRFMEFGGVSRCVEVLQRREWRSWGVDIVCYQLPSVISDRGEGGQL
jgi:hypothetical protein